MFQRRPTTQEITWFLDLARQQQLDLDPPYQRRSVWTVKDRQFFLDTIFNDYPCPPIFLHKTTDDVGRATYHVVDGKQRLETILLFSRGELRIADDFGNTKLDGKTFDALDAENKKRFWDYVLSVELISTVELVKQVFDRFNRNSRKLERQELRHAQFEGWFVNLAEDEAEAQIWLDLKVLAKSSRKRMKADQFISELILVVLEKNIFGFDQDLLDAKYAKYDIPETVPDFSIEESTQQLALVKEYIKEMEKELKVVSTHSRTLADFYSLWALIALNYTELPPAKELARKYESFMRDVAKQKATPDPKSEEFKYLTASQGATTDLRPRQDRLEAMEKSILGKTQSEKIESATTNPEAQKHERKSGANQITNKK
ncbi:MAG: DUF262 domain-containing protein [Candidatus Obscuribacterales bacterium]|nr:DUF262 domain-containing protein [Candidatus Obscuribacterales bacterium]